MGCNKDGFGYFFTTLRTHFRPSLSGRCHIRLSMAASSAATGSTTFTLGAQATTTHASMNPIGGVFLMLQN